MADKEATVYIVDVAKSMNKNNNGREQSDLDWALSYVWDRITATVCTLILREKLRLISGRSIPVVRLQMSQSLVSGTDASENDLADDDSYKHISVFQPLSQILMPQLRQLQDKLHTSKTDSRDAISGIVLAIMLIESFCKQLKYERRIVLVTNGTGQLDPDNTEEIATKLQKEGIHLTILGVDFDDPEYGSKEEDKPPAKAENEKVFRELVAKAGGTFGTLQEAIDELATPRVKAVRPVTTFKGELCLGNADQYETAITISIERYPRFSEGRSLPQLQW